MRRFLRPADPSARSLAARGLAAACLMVSAGCAAVGGGTSLPWCQATLRGEIADVDSTLSAVVVHWQAEGDEAQKAILEATLAEGARRRGYRVDVEGARGQWVAVRSDGGPPPGAGDLPSDRGGYAPVLAERLRRASARAVPPTKATVELQVQKFGVEVWTGEARFDPDPSRPASGAAAALRMLIARLPDHRSVPPPLRRIAADSVVAYYRDHLEGRTFACPVLPYPVRFPDLKRAYLRGGRDLAWDDTVTASLHDDPTLLPSVLDLVQWADAALPHSIPGYVDLAGAEIWRDVTLFDTFRADDGTEVALEVRLKGDTRGYDVAQTRILEPAAAEARRAAAAAFSDELARYMEHKGR